MVRTISKKGLTRNLLITPNHPISVEREFSVFHEDTSPLTKKEMTKLIALLNSKLDNKYRVVREVAGNSFELKISFSTVSELENDITHVYRVIAKEGIRHHFLILGISPPIISSEFNEFFTTEAFPDVRELLAKANSIHLHLGGYSESELITLYNASNKISPMLLDISQSSIVEDMERGRAVILLKFFELIPEVLSIPWIIRSFDDYYSALEVARVMVEEYINVHSNGNMLRLCKHYPSFAKMDGNTVRILRLTPDKVFHFGRLRPDMETKSKGLKGSVEIRSIDGQSNILGDIALIHLALGMLTNIVDNGLVELNKDEILRIMHDLRMARSDMDDGRRTKYMHIINKVVPKYLEILGIYKRDILDALTMMVLEPGYKKYVGLDYDKIIYLASSEFYSSVGV